MQVVNKCADLFKGIAFWIKCENPSVKHVVDICPHCFQWDSSLTVVVHNFSHLKDVAVAISALVETKTPIRHHGRQSNNLRVLLARLDWCRAVEEVEVENASQYIVLQILSILLRVVDFDFDSIGVEEKYAMSAIFGPGLVIDRMVTIQILTCWYAVAVSVPDGSSVVGGVQPVRIAVLAKPIKVRILRQGCAKTKILVLKDQRRSTCVK